MSSTNSTTTANVSLGFLSSEAVSLVEQAKRYRAEMEALPQNDPRRSLYETIIRDLLDRSRRFSNFTVTTSGTSSSS